MIDNGWETARRSSPRPRRRQSAAQTDSRESKVSSDLHVRVVARPLSFFEKPRSEEDRRARWRSPRSRGVYPPTPPDAEEDGAEDERVTSTSRRHERRLERERDRERR